MNDWKRRGAAAAFVAALLLAPIVLTGSALAQIPALTVPDDFSFEAESASGAIVTYEVSSDIGTPSCDHASGSEFPLGPTLVTCTATDASGNEASASFTVTVEDTTPPTLSGMPTDITEEATGAGGATISYTDPTATDLVDPSPTVICAPISGATFPLGETTVDCTATDASGNHDSASFTVTVEDTTPPTLSGAFDIVTNATGPDGATVTYNPSATDLVDPSPTVVCNPASPHTFELGTTSVECRATDATGNYAAKSFTVTVQEMAVISGASDITAEATGPDGAAVTYNPTAIDPVDSASVPVICGPTSPHLFGLGTTSVNCEASISIADPPSKNVSHASFTVTVRDTTPPAITGTPVQVAATAPSSGGIAVTYTKPTANDLVDGPRPVSCAPASGSTFAVGTTTVTCSATDSRGNNAHTSFPVIVSLEAPPNADPALVVPGALTAEATSGAGAIVNYDAASGDTPAPTIVCDPAPGSLFPFGKTMVTCTATNTGGGKTVRSFTINVRDTTAPVFAGKPANVVKKVSSKKRVRVAYKRPVATDIVDGNIKSVCAPRSGSKFKFGKTVVTCKATDAHKNTRKTSFTVRISSFGKRALISPLNGAVLSSPPRLKWTPIAKAGYYNVQIFRNGHKVLSAWPHGTSLRLKRNWRFGGARRHLDPGTYKWYVWPGFGSLAAANYGRIVGSGTFKIVR
jgi:hypothetical protein